ncbi:MAG: hypothetical protein R6T92_04275 [Desulfosalsimonadaceae bacterium]
MHLENNPMFRRTPVRWLDSSIVCIAGAMVMLAIALFAITGIRVAAAHPGTWLLWVPVLLLGLSTGLFLCLVIRFSRNRKSEK